MAGLTIPYDKNFLRMAILKQDCTFREQVGELHRLYRVQKLLMREMRREAAAAAEEEGEEVELTLATGGRRPRRRPAEEEGCGGSCSSSSSEVGREGTAENGEGAKQRASWFSEYLSLRIM
ncbi:unnamed protein product [Spirodela intermedia]|uniref:Uncharacterized protein n=2 Tax=Spirodela intermedia TaxID=51605 RepID=A0A7I8I7U7_SPIIN|nr:unnamed protein product [Spirodela intermedia]CAA6653544.1 unnamed protein product [Spirodela intermedia]CAA7387813.1 unnamed protein product [Spirodela intermedia]